MGKCHTVGTDRWLSTVNESDDDGKILIREEQQDKTFTGKHEKTNQELTGKCFESSNPAAKKHKIRFEVSTNKHLYVGVFINDNRIEGFRFKLAGADDEADAQLSGEEDWVATKGTD